MKKIYFIINPISGNARQSNELTKDLIDKVFSVHEYETFVLFTSKTGKTKDLVKDAIDNNADIIAACGGDGTINEIARHLVNTEIAFGIIPRGSGNGLASHLRISKNIDIALLTIKEAFTIKMDVGMAGSFYFFSNAGTGFVADVIDQYDRIPERKLPGYMKAGLKAIGNLHKNNDLQISINGTAYTSKNLFISNSSIMGYNMSLTPLASVQDGLLDIVILPVNSNWKFIVFCLFALFKKHHLLRTVQLIKTKSLKIRSENSNIMIQIDGEPLKTGKNEIEIKIIPAALKIIVPKEKILS